MSEALIASFLAGISTGIGAIPVLIFKKISHRVYDTLLGFAAGIMIAAASFNLILPALDVGGLGKTIFGIAIAAIFLYLVELVIPHLHEWHPRFKQLPLTISLRQGILMAIAITVHNFPEGLAVGVGYSATQKNLGLILALAIAAQNVPEGLAVAAPLKQAGISNSRCFILSTLSGIAEPIAAFFGLMLIGLSKAVLPFGLAFAGGAMLYIVFDEIIPECHSHGNEVQATFAAIVGFIVMIMLNVLFGV